MFFLEIKNQYQDELQKCTKRVNVSVYDVR